MKTKTLVLSALFAAATLKAQLAITLPSTGLVIHPSTIIFRVHRDGCLIRQEQSTYLTVTNQADFGAVTNACWPQIEIPKWNHLGLYTLKAK